MTDEQATFNPKTPQTLTGGNQTLLPQQTITVGAVVIPTNTHDVTGVEEPLPQSDESANIIVNPPLATVYNKRSTSSVSCTLV